MNSESESRSLQWLFETASKGRVFEHRILYQAALQPTGESDRYPRGFAMELSEKACIVFTANELPADENGRRAVIYEFVALFDDRDKAIAGVFSLITK
jgi:hypothetical protein